MTYLYCSWPLRANTTNRNKNHSFLMLWEQVSTRNLTRPCSRSGRLHRNTLNRWLTPSCVGEEVRTKMLAQTSSDCTRCKAQLQIAASGHMTFLDCLMSENLLRRFILCAAHLLQCCSASRKMLWARQWGTGLKKRRSNSSGNRI